MTGPPPRAAASLAVMRIAILAGLLLFGGVIWFLHRQPGWTPAAEGDTRALARVLPFALGAVGAVIVALRVASERARSAREARRLTIVGWSIAEAPAFAGGAHYFLTDDPRWYVAGLVLVIAAFVVLPIRRA